MESNNQTNVEYVLLTGSPGTDESIDEICDTVRHSLRTQFAGCTRVSVAIEGIDEFDEERSTIRLTED